MSSILRSILLTLAGSLALLGTAQAQRVGLVLSGGGAKGLYHIGVIKALEENGIPIDYIAGTSIGSIVAALYAAGYSPEEMEAIVASGQVRDWVSGHIDERYDYYYRQMQNRPSLLTLRLNLRSGRNESGLSDDASAAKSRLAIPGHLISSAQIDLALSGLLGGASTVAGGDFDRLMVPFRCVASDMVARRPCVLRDGDLGEAVRASMAIPLAFNPVRRDSMLLYDGGIYDNFPWRVLDETFHPDLLIGSKCTSGNTPPNDKSIMDQVWMLTMEQTDYDMPPERSVMIERAVDVWTLDFSAADQIIRSGYDDTLALIDSIKGRIPREVPRDEVARRRAAFRGRIPALRFDDYRIEGLNRAQTAYARDFMRLDDRRTRCPLELDFDALRDRYLSLLSDGNITTEYPRIRYDSLRRAYGIDLRMATKPNFKILIGGNISSTIFNQVYLGIEYQRIGRVANRYYTDLYLGPSTSTVMLGGRHDFFLWRPLFLDYSFNFAVQNFKNGNFGNLTSVNNTHAMKYLETYLSAGFGFPTSHRGVFSLRLNGGQERFYYSVDRDSYNEGYYEDITTFNYVSPRIELRYNTLDKVLFPHFGAELHLTGLFTYGRERFLPSLHTQEAYDGLALFSPDLRRYHSWWGARLMWQHYLRLGRQSWFSLGYRVDAVATTMRDFSNYRISCMVLPAYTPTMHSQTLYMPEFHASRFVAGGVMPTFDFSERFFLRTGVYAMYGTRELPTHDAVRLMADASLVYHTGVGPVSLSLTKYNFRDDRNLFLTFNFGYALCRPRGSSF